MSKGVLRLIESCREFLPSKDYVNVPKGLRGIYVLYRRHLRQGDEKYDVVYVGMAASGERAGIRGRLRRHRKKKENLWTHFSYFHVWKNITNEEISQLEGLFRHIYRHDQRANRLNVQRAYKPLTLLAKEHHVAQL